MLRRYLRFVAPVLILVAPAIQAQASVVVMGGLSAPVGDLSDQVDVGYNVSGGIYFRVPVLPIGIRVEGGYNGFSFKDAIGSNGDISIITGTVNALFTVSALSSAPYLIAGAGVYDRRISTPGAGWTSETTLGLNGGGGLRFPLSGFTTFFEARYHIMLGSSTHAANYQFAPVVFGIQF